MAAEKAEQERLAAEEAEKAELLREAEEERLAASQEEIIGDDQAFERVASDQGFVEEVKTGTEAEFNELNILSARGGPVEEVESDLVQHFDEQ